MNANELTPYGEALEKILLLQDLLITEQKEVLRLMGEVEELKELLANEGIVVGNDYLNNCIATMRKAQE